MGSDPIDPMTCWIVPQPARFPARMFQKMPTLLLVDGSSYLYRAFHALPDLRNSHGEPTGAIRGVLSMLRRLESDYKAEFRACVFDAKGKTFRDDWYPEYKSHRPPMPDDLRAQIEPLHEAVQAEGWPLLSIEGVEADDVIGTLTRQAHERGWEVVISTGDKDLTQLVRPGVRWVNTMSEEVLDEAGVEAKFGVPPERIVDYLTLVGDTVDNVPGVEKCGPKTAVKWLTEYGTLDNLVANADKVGGKVGENLRKHLDFLPLGKRLVTVATDVELPVGLDELPAREDDKAALRALESEGIGIESASFVAGHSLGEYTALVAAGALSLRGKRSSPRPVARKASASPAADTTSPSIRLAVPTKPATKRLLGKSYRPAAEPTCCRMPLSSTAMRSAVVMASSWSWVTKMVVSPSLRCRFFSSSRICTRSCLSRLDSGSSSSSTGGSITKARARATRWRWPPESCSGQAWRLWLIPRRSSRASRRAMSRGRMGRRRSASTWRILDRSRWRRLRARRARLPTTAQRGSTA